MSALERVLPEVEAHALHRYMGVERIQASDGESRFEIIVNEQILNPRAALHGGVIYTLCDMACYTALLSTLADNEDAATHDLHVSVLRAAKLGDRVSVHGRVLKRGRHNAFMEAELHSGGKLLAKASVTKSIVVV